MWFEVTKVVIAVVVTALPGYSLPTVSDPSTAHSYSQVVEYFQQLGYLPEAQPNSHVDYKEFLPSAISSFQQMARLPMTGILDEKTVQMLNKPRCGVKDPISISARSKRFAHSGSKWQTNIISWRITQFSQKFPHVHAIQTMKNAFQQWSDVTNLYFEYKPTGDVDIEVKFARGNHGDGYNFDRRGGVLAHAFFPPSSEDSESDKKLAGDLHFDDDERWVVDLHDAAGTSLPSVAIHEIGHSLGLQHSNVHESVMWPWTKEEDGLKKYQLAYDDVAAVQSLYGGLSHRVQRDNHPHPFCRQRVDAIFTAVDGNIYLFTGHTVLKLDSVTFETVGGPTSISSIFHGIPARTAVDGAVTYQGQIWPIARSYIFIGRQFYRYSMRNGEMMLDDHYPASIFLKWNMTESDFSSVFKLDNINKLIFVKDQRYWIHTGTTFGPYRGYPRQFYRNRVFGQMHQGINAAFLHRNGTNYLFDGTNVKVKQPGSSRLRNIC